MTALVAAPAVPAVPDIGEYLAGRYLATHKERLLDTREDKRLALDAGLPLAERMPLPRPTRAEYEEAQWRQAQGSAPAVLQALPSRETP